MDLLNDNECSTKLQKCYIKRVKRNMEDTHPFLRGGAANYPTLLKRKENARDCKTKKWQGPSRNFESFLEATK